MAGLLMGDAWMALPNLVHLCRSNDVSIIAGTYTLPLWLWASKNIEGADYTIVRVMSDPDNADADLCPGKGFVSIDRAAQMVQRLYPDAEIRMPHQLASHYRYGDDAGLTVTGFSVHDGEHVVVHPYTRHEWKNIVDLTSLEFFRQVYLVGKPGESRVPEGWIYLSNFDDQVRMTLQARAVVGPLSSFTNLAAMFGKIQIVASFTEDVPISHARAHIRIRPDLNEMQKIVKAQGL
jgi:hypothetical protein